MSYFQILEAFLTTSKLVHIIGIGGVGMSAIARWLIAKEYKVQGSDFEENAFTKILSDLGAKIYIGQNANNILNADIIIKSSAISDKNPEIISAKELNIPIINRQEALSFILKNYPLTIAVSGTHGKTTTTAMLAAIFEAAHKEPTVFCGGEINSYKSNFKLGSSEICLVEADESDGTFCNIPYYSALLTNLEAEHLDYYENFSNLKNQAKNFIEKISQLGFAILNSDDPNSFSLLKEISLHKPDKIILCSLNSSSADFQVNNISYLATKTDFTVTINPKNTSPSSTLNFTINALGEHNVRNAVMAIAAAYSCSIDLKTCKLGLENIFCGVKKRFTKLGELNGVTIIDDYAHHPTEIFATLNSASQFAAGGEIIAIIQPHRYSRIKLLKKEYLDLLLNIKDITKNIILLPAESGGETFIEGSDSEALYNSTELAELKLTNKLTYIKDINLLHEQLNITNLSKGTLIIFMGAGNTTYLAHKFFQRQKLLTQSFST